MKDDEFKELLTFGQEYEQLAKHYIDYDTIHYAEGKCSEYDFYTVTNNKKMKYEVKADTRAIHTGNMAIEYLARGQRSGLTITEAKHYIYFVVTDGEPIVYLIPTRILRRAIRNKEYEIVIQTGYKQLSTVALFKLSKFSEYIVYRTDGRQDDNTV